MLPFELETVDEVARGLATRVRALRLVQNWTQKELSERAGLKLDTYRVFERTGKISLERLIRLARVLDALDGFNRLFPQPEAQSLDELEQRDRGKKRQRARHRDA
jgi:transcriptional regulator with XRE-family HTH domain